MRHIDFKKENIHHLKRRNNPRRQSAVGFSFLAKLHPIDRKWIQKCEQCLRNLLLKSLNQMPASQFPLVIGLAESGIIPSALMHQIARELGIEAYWICSTRRVASGIRFTESHSHGPNHILPLCSHQPTEIWFIEDEITTGRTLLNLILKLCPLSEVKSIRVFSFFDTRTLEEKIQFDETLAKHDIKCSTEILIHEEKTSQDTFSLQTIDENSYLSQEQVQQKTINSVIDSRHYQGWLYSEKRPALNAQLNHDLNLPTDLKGNLLAVGEVIDLALRLLQVNPDLFLQHITLNPWEIDQNIIFNYLQIKSIYNLYNYKQLQAPIYILSDPVDQDVAEETKELLLKEGLKVENLSLDTIYSEDRHASI